MPKDATPACINSSPSIATGKTDAGVGVALRCLKPLEQGLDVAGAALKQELKAHAGDLKLVSIFKSSTDAARFAERIYVDVFDNV